jgi:hypothetical protein
MKPKIKNNNTMKQVIFILSVFTLMVLASCQPLDEYRENPNNVTATHPKLLLTKIGKSAFDVEQGAESCVVQYTSRMMIISDITLEEQFYTWSRGNYGKYDELRDVQKMMEEATRIESPAYRALAKVFRSIYFYDLTITFGDIPYSQALKGEADNTYQPEYDTQKQVFQGILKELEEANDTLAVSQEIIEGDIIYNGDLTNWRKFINSFRLKVLLTLSDKESDSDLNVASEFANIVANEPIINSVAENGQLIFYDLLDSRYTEFNDSRFASAVFLDETFVERLAEREDPRLFIYADQTPNAKEAGLAIDDFTGYGGGNPIATTDEVYEAALAGRVSVINPRYHKDPVNEPHMVLGYPEVQFILAEAVVRGWIAGNAKTYYENGVKGSFEFYNMYAEKYAQYVEPADADNYLLNTLVNYDNATSDDERIELIITQKYLQSFLQNKWTPYFEHLRTGYPSFAYQGSNTPPTRWMYPQEAFDYNQANVDAAIARQFGANNDNTREIPWWLK